MRGLLLFSLFLSTAYAQWEQCDGYDCLTKEELIAELKRAQAMRKEYFASMTSTATKSKRPSMLDVFDESTTWADVTGTPASVQNQCNICSDPSVCLNGGTCQVDPTNPWGNYICDCPGNYTGTHCETLVKCEANTCGTNTTCSVSNHQTNCVCLPGYSGDPVKGCTARTRSSCTFGDPHYTTFDGLGYDYQGTCPLVFAQPCTTLGGGYDDFSVVHKNELIYPTAHLSAPAEVDIVMFGQQIHFDRISGSMYFNQVRVALPFHWPSSSDPKITLSLNGVTLTAASSQLVTVTLTRNSYPTLCVEVPDIPVFRGNALCGLAGNIDNNYHDDIICRNGSIFPITQSSNNPIASQAHDFNVCLDSWIVPEFFYTSTSSVCAPGALMGNVTSCPIPPAQAKCQPLADAMIGEGVFGQCQGMGNETIQRLYDACVFDLCYQSSLQCSTYTNFVEICQQMLPDTDLGPWRQNTSCIKQCGPNSEYSSCTSACPATCAQHDAPSTCNQGCVDGCECDYGFVADNTVTSRLSCIRIQDCGCEDPNGNIHSADQPWLDDDCTLAAICQNGTYFNETVSCGTYATCGSDSNHNMACQCEPGFTGNGFNCEDINECNDPNSCGAGQGLGSCQNTIGSYNCTCNMYQLGRDCQDFMPKRSCADLVRYWNKTEDGVYNLELPDWSSNSSGWFFDVYCDMTTDNGGWTLMSHDSGNMMSNKTFFDYQQGFGFPSDQNVWLGLEAITAMTNDFPTKLRLEIFRCYPPTGYDNMTECTYPSFTVLGAEEGYAVQIPEYCSGTETDTYSMFTRGTDGWVDWCIGSSCLTATGPAFSTDNVCSETANDVGFWYNMALKAQCGSANLNGNRFACDNAPLITSTDVLKWYRNTLGDVWMYLRPANFPNY